MKRALLLGAIFAAAATAVVGSDFSMEAPMETKSGRHYAVTCTNTEDGKTLAFNTRETTAVWRPFGINTYEFTDKISGERKGIPESKMSKSGCKMSAG